MDIEAQPIYYYIFLYMGGACEEKKSNVSVHVCKNWLFHTYTVFDSGFVLLNPPTVHS